MAEFQSTIGAPGLVGIYETYKDELDRNTTPVSGYAPNEQAGSWRRVPYVNLLPDSRRPLPVKLIIRTGLAVVIGLLVLMTINGYLDWKAIEANAESTRFDTESVNRRLSARQSEIQPLQAQIGNLTSDLESAESTYQMATAGQADWFTTISGLFSFSDGGVDLLSAEVEADGTVLLTGAASNTDVIAFLPNQLSALEGVLDLKGIEWDLAVSPPIFTAELQVSR